MADRLPPLADGAELARKVGRLANDPLVVDAVRQASARFREAVGHPVTRVVGDTVELDGGGTRSLTLPAVPVVSIESVTVDGIPLPPTSYRAVKRTGILRRRDGRVWPRGAAIDVVYSHGFGEDDVPEGISAVVLERAEMIYAVIAGVQSKSVLGDSVSFSTATIGSTEDWTRTVNNYAVGLGDEA